MKVHTMPQRSPEWYDERAGDATGSRAGDILKKVEAAGRRDYRLQLVTENLTNAPQDGPDGFVSPAMQHGLDVEANAFAAYEAHTGQLVTRVGYVSHDDHAAGCSPDGLIGWDGEQRIDGVLELKAPKSATHVGYLRADTLPKTYQPQILHALWITGAAWADFVSFDDRLPEPLQLFIHRVTRDDVAIKAYEKSALAFLEEVQAETQALRTLAEGFAGVGA